MAPASVEGISAETELIAFDKFQYLAVDFLEGRHHYGSEDAISLGRFADILQGKFILFPAISLARHTPGSVSGFEETHKVHPNIFHTDGLVIFEEAIDEFLATFVAWNCPREGIFAFRLEDFVGAVVTKGSEFVSGSIHIHIVISVNPERVVIDSQFETLCLALCD